MQSRPFGNTGLRVSALGLGAGHLGDPALGEQRVAELLHGALDLGVTLVDTARSYGLSEERIGRHLAGRRGEFVLSTKGGYGVPGIPDWTGACIEAGVDAALGRLRTDRIDVLHLHSCPLEVLERADLQQAVERVVRSGKVLVAAYSGEGAPLARAIASGRFGSVQASVNLCDQRILDTALPAALERGLGVIAKRPLANAPWRHAAEPEAPDVRTYWQRWQALALRAHDLAWDELALRFAAFTPGVSSCIVGTTSLEHLRRAAAALANGALPQPVLDELRRAWREHGRDWEGLI